MADTFLWLNIGFIAVYVMLGLYIYFGIKFIRDSREYDKGTAPRAYFAGLGLFVISVAIGEGTYLSDLVFRAHNGGVVGGKRIFWTTGMWKSVIGYEIGTIIVYDYYLVTFTFILISLSFLMKPLETFMLRREKPIITYLNRILIPFPLLIRLLELNLANWLGVNFRVLEGGAFFYIFTVLWSIVIGAIALSVAVLMGLYLKMGIKSPKGSNIRKKSILINLGIIFWMAGVFLTSTIFKSVSSGDWYLFPVIALLILLSLVCMMSGFKREF